MPDEAFTQLSSARLVLRRFQPADLAAFVAYRSDPEVARFQSWDAPYPAAEGLAMIDDLTREHPDTPGRWFQYAVELRSTHELIGDCAAKTDGDDPRLAEIGYTLAPQYQGHGYATEAARTLLGYLFGPRAKHRVAAYCDARNAPSVRLLERLGMRREGHLIQSSWAKGEWTDDLLYALLASEWDELSRND